MSEEEAMKRMDLWCSVWVAVAGCLGVTDPGNASKWADKALEEFDVRFGSKREGA